MGNMVFDIVGRYFWLICLAISAYQYYDAAGDRVTAKDNLGESMRVQRIRYLRWLIGASALPWLVMGLGQLTGSTTSVWDYLRPQDFNAFVVAFVGCVFMLSLILAYWVFFMDGARKATELKLGWTHGFPALLP
jgi:hypothetical protein